MNKQDKEIRELAEKFHEAYERLAPEYGYETRPETKQFDPESPNGKLMIAVCDELLDTMDWVSVKTPPEESGEYIVSTLFDGKKYMKPYTAYFNKDFDHWNRAVDIWKPMPALPEPPHE